MDKQGKLYFQLIIAAALLVALVSVALFSYFNGGNSGSASQALSVSEQSLPLLSSSEAAQQSPPARPLGSISFQSVKSDSSINAVIDSSQKLDSGNLLVKFHHNSAKEEPVTIIGNVRYELSKNIAKPNEIITLTVFGWSTEYSEIKVGATSSIVGFGRKVLE